MSPAGDIAYALFGGICAGKTTVADRLAEELGATIVSKDRLIYESDVLARDGTIVDFADLRAARIAAYSGGPLILDETIRAGALTPLSERGLPIDGVRLSAPLEVRLERLQSRIRAQESIVKRLSAIVGIDLSGYSREERRELWRSADVYDRIQPLAAGEFGDVLQTIYHSGSHVMKDDVPDPLYFPELRHVSEFDEFDGPDVMTQREIALRRIPYLRYRDERAGRKIACCIWDIGGVLYDFSLAPFEEFAAAHRPRDPSVVADAENRFSLGPYMRGSMTFADVAKSLAEHLHLAYSSEFERGLESALRRGVQTSRTACRTMMAELRAAGVRNVILSNALPILLDTGDYQDEVTREDRFYSFDSGHLKPEPEAYLHVLERVGVAPEHALFIDDKSRNVEAAEALGICGIVFEENRFSELMRRKLGRSMGWPARR